MKFQITTTTGYYPDSQIPKLEKLGFSFAKIDNRLSKQNEKSVEIELETLDDLLSLCKEVGLIIVSNFDSPEIEIYDGDRE